MSQEPPAPVPVPRAPFVVLVLLVVVGGVLGILLLNTKINENAFVLHELRQQQAELDQRQQRLEQEIAQASSTAQLAAAARRLGLVDRSDDLAHLRLAEEPTAQPVGS
jgi:cell division protein FtsB